MSDARFVLWEKLCTCGGERTGDVRMCTCLASHDAGLACMGCKAGVLLPKTGPRGLFWGCSKYKKLGCKFTKHWGPPYDKEAAQRLEAISVEEKIKARYEESIQDPFELEWYNECHCDGAKDLNTFECYMRSSGGCGMLPACPECGQSLFLKQGQNGKYWGCSRFKSGCNFRRSYVEHTSLKSVGTKLRSPADKAPAQDPLLSPEQKERIARNRAAAFARLKGRSVLMESKSTENPSSPGTKHNLVTPSRDDIPPSSSKKQRKA